MFEAEIAAIVAKGDRLGRAAFRGSWKEADVVLKLMPPARSWRNRLSRRIVGSSLPFLNEFYVNAALNAGHFSALQFATMLDGSPGQYLLFECLSYETDSHDLPLLQRCADALHEFNALDYHNPLPLFHRLLLRILEAPAYRTIRLALFHRYPWRLRLKILLTVVQFELTQRAIVPVLLHNDLAFSNVAVTTANEIVFLDFEDVVSECKWILVDAVDLEFDRKNMSLHLNVILKYWRRLVPDMDGETGKVQFRNQVRMCVMRHILLLHNNPHFTDEERRRAGQFLEVLLDNHKFSSWFDALERWRHGG